MKIDLKAFILCKMIRRMKHCCVAQNMNVPERLSYLFKTSFGMFNTLHKAEGLLAVRMYQTTWLLIPEVRHLSIHLCEQRKYGGFQATEAVYFEKFFLPGD
jgi:hypothetical protein